MISRRLKLSLMVLVVSAVAACSADITTGSRVPPPPPSSVLLKEIDVGNLDAPLYQFSYDAAGRYRTAAFAGFRFYDVSYDGNRIRQLANDVTDNNDRVVYSYDNAGRVSSVRYLDAGGITLGYVDFGYDGQRLVSLTRNTRVDGSFVVDKQMAFAYFDDGNLSEIDLDRPPISGGQQEVSQIFRFDDYDHGINVDGFTLIHNDFFDHLVLLPGVQLQRSNARHLTIATRVGDGPFIRVDVIYTYLYDTFGRPVAKYGDVTVVDGPNAGEQTQADSFFSYY